MTKSVARRRAPRGLAWQCVKWWPHLFVPFGVLFAEAFMHVETLRNDYNRARVNAGIQELQLEIQSLRSQEASLQRLDATGAFVPGLIEPNPNQIEILALGSNDETLSESEFDVAEARSVAVGGAPASH